MGDITLDWVHHQILKLKDCAYGKPIACCSKLGMCIAVFFLELCVESQYVGVLCKPYKYTASFSLELCTVLSNSVLHSLKRSSLPRQILRPMKVALCSLDM